MLNEPLEQHDLHTQKVSRMIKRIPIFVALAFLVASTLSARAGESVASAPQWNVGVDYALRLKRELTMPDGPAIWVAGYSNVYSGYIPNRRVLLEGGYEARSRPWKPTLEERIVGKVHELVKSLP